MPIPIPGETEDKTKFISRCMGTLVGEGKPQKQAYAICMDSWKKKKMMDMDEPEMEDEDEMDDVPEMEDEDETEDSLEKIIQALIIQYLGKIIWG